MLKRLAEGEDPLELSIQKWVDIVNGIEDDHGGFDCALCKAYPDVGCTGCPVQKETGYSNCRGTPYTRYVIERTRENAQRELNFLISLRPKKKEREF